MATTTKEKKKEVKKISKKLLNVRTVTTNRGTYSNVSGEEFEKMLLEERTTILRGNSSEDGDRTINAAYKRIEKVLSRAGITPVMEDGEFWVKLEHVDLDSLPSKETSLELPDNTYHVLGVKKRGKKRIMKTIKTASVYSWACVYFSEGDYKVWINETDIFNCKCGEIETLPEFLKTYFTSKYGKGLIVTTK